ncbi:unnamed protein product [Caenorhabditis bovis]|uniref:PHD-type domain-containing protein n=1 Tax=Caenorhabditis bovis TaxID=2654633 RepID=A0A8S1FA68_9PELO|nr:unnamed protein product [Caenorhabditis bovis]
MTRSDSDSDEIDAIPKSAIKPPPPKKKKVRKRAPKKRKTSNDDDEEYHENRAMVKTLNEKFKSKKLKNDEAPTFTVKHGVAEFRNSENHNTIVSRACDYNINRISQFEEQSDAFETPYVCSLCQLGVQFDELGDLFGPYYVNLNSAKTWPAFFGKRPAKKLVRVELWFHGDCALWAPGVHMIANELSNLEVLVEKFWSKKCENCSLIGATIQTPAHKPHFLHYKCALNRKEYKLDYQSLTCKLK